MKIDQFLPTLAARDGVGSETLIIQTLLKKWGYKSRIFAEKCHPDAKKQFNHFKKHKKSDLLIYHHSIGCDIAEYVKQTSGKKMLIYHNITPEYYLKDTDPEAAYFVNLGRKQLEELKGVFDLPLADSEYNRQELEEIGFKNTHTLPLLTDFDKYSLKPQKAILDKYRDGYKNIIFTGKVVPHKNQADILKVFYCYKTYINPKSRLIFIGNVNREYLLSLEKQISQLKLKDVIFTHSVSQKELIAYYQIADIFLCMSKHEGFCIPLIESMYFKVPIVAYNKTAVPWTLSGSSIVFDTTDYLEIAELINYVMINEDLRNRIIKQQTKRLKYFRPESTILKLKQFISTLI